VARLGDPEWCDSGCGGTVTCRVYSDSNYATKVIDGELWPWRTAPCRIRPTWLQHAWHLLLAGGIPALRI